MRGGGPAPQAHGITAAFPLSVALPPPTRRTAPAAPRPQPVYRSPDDSDISPAYGHHPHGKPHGKPPYYKKRKHWLLELLD